MDKKISVQMISRRILPVFILIIMLFTIISRILDTIRIPKVKSDYLQKQSINYEISGTGNIEAGEVVTISTEQGLIIREISSFTGKSIKTGDVLFSYQVGEIKEKYKDIERELNKLEISLSVEKERNSILSKMSSSELADQKLEKTKEVLSKTEDKHQKIQEEYQNQLEKLNENYQKNKEKSKEERVEEKYQEYMTALRNYKTALIDGEQAISLSEWELEQAKMNLEDAGFETEEELSRKVSHAKKTLRMTKEKWELNIEEAEQNMIDKSNVYEALRDNPDNAMIELEAEYEADKKKLESEYTLKEIDLENAQSDYANALQELSNAKITDSNDAQKDQQQSKISFLEQKSISLSIEEKKQALVELETLIENDGQIRANHDGIITKMDFSVGQVASGNEIIQIGYGSLLLKGSITEEDMKLVEMGDSLNLIKSGKYLSDTVCILESVVQKGEDERAEIIAKVDSDELLIGEKVSFKVISASAVYEKVVPLSAIRKDKDEEYVLVVQEKNTIMGTEQTAMKVVIKIIEKNTKSAAIEGNLLKDHMIILEETRSIKEGDRVRVVSK